jgi:hypothetical protein
MKKTLLSLLCFSFILSFNGCLLLDKEEETSPKPRSIEEDLEIVKKYMSIDKETNQYVVTIDEETRHMENIAESNLKYILGDIAALNQKVAESIRDGHIVTLYLTREEYFESFTVNNKNTSGIEFKDIRVPFDKKAKTRGAFLSSVTFSDGNWNSTSGSSFIGSDHVTSELYIGYCRGYWQVQFTCTTGTSSYGTLFISYGTGGTSGGINRYWWWTNGGGEPFKWNFELGGPPGGQANGGITFTNT